jgi:hypothetical protein
LPSLGQLPPSFAEFNLKSRKGRPKIAHRFIGGNPSGKKGQVPSGTEEIVAIPERFLSSLTGLVSSGDVTPALKRWAIVGRPAGLEEQASVTPVASRNMNLYLRAMNLA